VTMIGSSAERISVSVPALIQPRAYQLLRITNSVIMRG